MMKGRCCYRLSFWPSITSQVFKESSFRQTLDAVLLYPESRQHSQLPGFREEVFNACGTDKLQRDLRTLHMNRPIYRIAEANMVAVDGGIIFLFVALGVEFVAVGALVTYLLYRRKNPTSKLHENLLLESSNEQRIIYFVRWGGFVQMQRMLLRSIGSSLECTS